MILALIRYIIAGVSIAFLSTICALVFLLRPTHYDNTYYAARLIGNIGCWIMGIKLEVENPHLLQGLESQVIISNHQSNFDIFYFGKICPRHTVTVGKKDIAYFPFFGQMYWLSGNILIDRKNRTKAWNVMDRAVEKITKSKANVWIMPEGTRSKGRGTLPFKKGAFVTAIKAQKPVTAVCVSSFDKSIDITKWRSGTLKVKVLGPFSTKGLTNENLTEFKDKVQQEVQQTVVFLDKSYT